MSFLPTNTFYLNSASLNYGCDPLAKVSRVCQNQHLWMKLRSFVEKIKTNSKRVVRIFKFI